jgi:glycosyltransferase involved in cell wall biosynthesis
MASILGPLRLRRSYDVIFVHEPSPITVGIPAIAMRKRTQAPILFWVLDLWPESVTAAGGVRAPWVLGLLARLTRWIYGHCERVLVASRAFIPRVGAMGVAEERISYFPNWAEEVFQPSTAVEPPAPLSPGFRVMFAGNIGVAQDFPAILEAAEQLKGFLDIHWIVLGDGHMGGWVRDEVVRRGIGATVHLLGSYPPEQMPQFFAHADAMLVSLKPDPVFSLTVPAKLQAYMACGRPIIAMLDGEGARIVEEAGAGVTCPAGDGHALAEAVLGMVRLNPQTRAKMGTQALAYSIANFEREQIFRRLEAWMVEAAGRREIPART